MMFLKDKYFVSFFILGILSLFILTFLKTNFHFFWYLDKPLSFFNLIIVSSVAEEVIFRGLLFDFFERKYSQKICVLLTSVLFGLSHLFVHSPLWAAATILPGILFGILKLRTKKVYASITLHFLFNFMYFSLYEF